MGLAWTVMNLVIAGAHGLDLGLAEPHATAATIAERAIPRINQQAA